LHINSAERRAHCDRVAPDDRNPEALPGLVGREGTDIAFDAGEGVGADDMGDVNGDSLKKARTLPRERCATGRRTSARRERRRRYGCLRLRCGCSRESKGSDTDTGDDPQQRRLTGDPIEVELGLHESNHDDRNADGPIGRVESP
jgi:hypothetical protein